MLCQCMFWWYDRKIHGGCCGISEQNLDWIFFINAQSRGIASALCKDEIIEMKFEESRR